MAGIGFALGSLYRSHTIAGRAAAYAHASIVVAGPCIAAVLCIWLIGVFMEDSVEQAAVSEFRALVIYCFAISFVVTAPIAYVSARLVADKLHEGDVMPVPGIMLAAIAITAITVVLVAGLVFGAFLDLDNALLAATIADCTLVGFIWIGALFCSVTRDYASITAFFGIGMLTALIAVTLLYPYWPSLAGMMWAFSAGVGVIVFGLLGRILATFPFSVGDLQMPVRRIALALRNYWPIALGGLVGAIAAWIDKWIIWFSPIGQHIGLGLVHAPLYDSAMFLSYLIAVPAYAAFFLRLEVRFFAHYRRYYSDILGHATLRQIETNARKLREVTLSSISGIMIPQAAICAVVAVAAPLIIETLGMQFRQVAMLRLGVVGASFQFLFMTCSSLILYFDRRIVFLTLQAIYLLLNSAFTLASLILGISYLGAGFLFAAVLAAALAYLALARTFYRLDYLTFIGNNPALRAQ